ncbi:MAG: phosphoglycolate phosphatase [Acidocella sp. 20-58-15]|jgi:phosphoglycolate phosphatase|nr:MAG: phosphoglycolate phosphatase [Acidocella sp. 20-58-15]
MRAVVFDLDGTLIDSLPDIAAAANYVLAGRGLPPVAAEKVRFMIGDGARVLVDRAFAAHGETAGEAEYRQFEEWYTAHASDLTVAYPGIAEALQHLHAAGHKLAVCTNKPKDATREILSALKLDQYFSAVTGGNSTPYRKPDPRHLAATLAELGTDDAIMIGDHHNDMAAAAGLGLPAIFAAWGYGEAASPLVAQTAYEIPGLVAGLAK